MANIVIALEEDELFRIGLHVDAKRQGKRELILHERKLFQILNL